jgi:hypothetical protein
VLKNSFQGTSRTKFVRKLLNLRSPWALKSTEITALVPFSTATGDFTHNPDRGRSSELKAESQELTANS